MKSKLVLMAFLIGAVVLIGKPEADIGTSLSTSSVADTITANNYDATWQQIATIAGLATPSDSDYVRTVEVSGTVKLNRYERFYLGLKLNTGADSLNPDSMSVKWEEIQTYIHGTFQAVLPFHLMYTDTTTVTATTDTVWVSAAKLGGAQIELANVYVKISVEAMSGQ